MRAYLVFPWVALFVTATVAQEKPAGVIFASAKAKSFVAGADLFEIRRMDREQVEQFYTWDRVAERMASIYRKCHEAIGHSPKRCTRKAC